METSRKTPREIARRLASKSRALNSGAASAGQSGSWRRESFTLPRGEARAKAREWFERFPKAAYMTEIEFWRELDGDVIEFTIRRLPSAD